MVPYDMAPTTEGAGRANQRTFRLMLRSNVERRLKDVSKRLASLRDDLRIADEQLMQLADEAEDARLRALVSETPLAEREHKNAERHAQKMRSHREGVQSKIARLEVQQDELLDKMTG